MLTNLGSCPVGSELKEARMAARKTSEELLQVQASSDGGAEQTVVGGSERYAWIQGLLWR